MVEGEKERRREREEERRRRIALCRQDSRLLFTEARDLLWRSAHEREVGQLGGRKARR